LTHAKARHESLYGPVDSGWRLAEQKMVVNVEVPANTIATIRLPKTKLNSVKESGKSLDNSEGITDIQQDGEAVVMLVGSGRYSFEYPW
jgi:alpha-L-rhamnosidase